MAAGVLVGAGVGADAGAARPGAVAVAVAVTGRIGRADDRSRAREGVGDDAVGPRARAAEAHRDQPRDPDAPAAARGGGELDARGDVGAREARHDVLAQPPQGPEQRRGRGATRAGTWVSGAVEVAHLGATRGAVPEVRPHRDELGALRRARREVGEHRGDALARLAGLELRVDLEEALRPSVMARLTFV